MSSSSSVSTLSVQSSVHNDDSSNKGNLFPLSITGNDCHTQGIATKITLNNETYTNEYLEQKKIVLKKIIIKDYNIHITSIILCK